MVTTNAGLRTENDCAGECQQQFTRDYGFSTQEAPNEVWRGGGGPSSVLEYYLGEH
jgi:hypothetical protein